jgi:hypothetical protein
MRKTVDDIAEDYQTDIHQKKQQYKSIQAGKRRSKGAKNMRYPYETMSRSERLKYTKAGTITVTNLFDKILTRAEFDQLPEDEQKKRLIYWRDKYSQKEIYSKLQMGSATYYKMIDAMGIPAGRRGKYKKEKVKGKISDYVPAETKEETAVQSPAVIEAPQQIVLNGLNLAYNGSYKSDEIRRILAKIDLVLDGEENEFQIELRVSEIVKDKEEEKEESKELLNV